MSFHFGLDDDDKPLEIATFMDLVRQDLAGYYQCDLSDVVVLDSELQAHCQHMLDGLANFPHDEPKDTDGNGRPIELSAEVRADRFRNASAFKRWGYFVASFAEHAPVWRVNRVSDPVVLASQDIENTLSNQFAVQTALVDLNRHARSMVELDSAHWVERKPLLKGEVEHVVGFSGHSLQDYLDMLSTWDDLYKMGQSLDPRARQAALDMPPDQLDRPEVLNIVKAQVVPVDIAQNLRTSRYRVMALLFEQLTYQQIKPHEFPKSVRFAHTSLANNVRELRFGKRVPGVPRSV